MNPFRRSSSRFGREPEPETPYQRAGQAWDDRIGSARSQAHSWRLMAFGASALLSLSVVDNLRLRFGSHIVPYVVEVDRVGQARSVAPALADYRPTDPQIAVSVACGPPCPCSHSRDVGRLCEGDIGAGSFRV